jgi:pSer/pThr/pTyr-binding forkhead associated (FHA) protein
MWKLVIEDDEGKRTVVPLTRDEYSIGRKEGNSIRLTERNVSRDHAKVSRRAGPTKEKPIFTLGDLTSYNGVYVNGLRVADKQDLANGDLIQIGDYRIVLQDEASDPATDVPDDGAVSIDPEDLKETVSTGPLIPLALRATNATFLEKPNRLVVLAGPNPGEEFPLVGERLTIGRAEDATISINHNSVSRLHCEVHSLGEGRFEIVDKGSSNGVRVNGADLRRGIIEAGDVIELGDVKFKFVGEGQLFRPGTTESQQLAALSQRAAAVQVRSSGSKLLPVLLVLAVAGLAILAIMAMKSPKPHVDATPDAVPTVAPADTSGADAAMLADARRMCDIGDVEAAHQKAGTLPATSQLHSSADFLLIESKWSTMMLLQADSEQDPQAKAAILQRLIADPFADATIKKTAAARLGAIDASRDSGKHPPKSTTTTATVTQPVSPSNPRPPSTPPIEPPPPRPPATPSPSLVELVTSSNPADVQKAREILEQRVFGHRGSPSDVRMLKAICKQQHDQQCIDALKQ